MTEVIKMHVRETIQTSGGGGTTEWGNITGTLADQTDLATALNGKAATSDVTNGFVEENLPTEIPAESVLQNSEMAYKPDTTQYILLYIDDALASLSDAWTVIHSYNIPVNVAVPTDRLNSLANNGQTIKALLHDMEDAGCEILSHSTDTNVLTQNTTRAEAYARLRDSKTALLAEGFKVNGFCEPGGVNAKTFTEMGYDDLVRMFYLYSDTGIYPQGINKRRSSLSDVSVENNLKAIKQGQNGRKLFFHAIGTDVTLEYLQDFISTAISEGFVFTTEYNYYYAHAYSLIDDRIKKLEKITETYKTIDAELAKSSMGMPNYDRTTYPYAFTIFNGDRRLFVSDAPLVKDKTAPANQVTLKKSDDSSFTYKRYKYNSGAWTVDKEGSATSYNSYQNQNPNYSNYDIYDTDGTLVCGVSNYYAY